MTVDILDAARWPVPERDDARVAALHGYGVLDQAAAPDLDVSPAARPEASIRWPGSAARSSSCSSTPAAVVRRLP